MDAGSSPTEVPIGATARVQGSPDRPFRQFSGSARCRSADLYRKIVFAASWQVAQFDFAFEGLAAKSNQEADVSGQHNPHERGANEQDMQGGNDADEPGHGERAQ